MNFGSVDMNLTLMNMIQKDLSKGTVFNSDDTGFTDDTATNQVFAEKLTKIFNKQHHTQDQPQGQAQKTDTLEKDLEKVVESISKDLENGRPVSFLSKLKSLLLMMSQGDLSNISINPEGLAALKKLLVKAGLDEAQVTDLMGELAQFFENNELALSGVIPATDELTKEKELKISDFFDKLFDLAKEAQKPDDKMPDSDNLLQVSAIPFIESLLNSLGIPQEKISEILSEASLGDKGISLDIIIDKLQKLEEKSFQTQTLFSTQEGDDSFLMLFKQLGLEQPEGQTAQQLTLKNLVNSLENLREEISIQTNQNDMSGVAQSEEKSKDLLNSLFKALDVTPEQGALKSGEFTTEQIRDHIKNGLFLNDKNSEKLGELLANAGDGKKITLADVFKEIAALMPEKQDGGPDFTNLTKLAGEGFTKNLKSALNKSNEQVQVAASDVKTPENSFNLETVKTRPAPKTLPAYVTNQVSKSLVRAINQGESSLRIQLKPPEMGRLLMTIENMGNNSMKVSIVTENSAAKEILASNIQEIKTVLSNSGVNLEKFDVDMGEDFSQSMADARRQAGGFNKRNRQNNQAGIDPATGNRIDDSDTEMTGGLDQDGSLHYVA